MYLFSWIFALFCALILPVGLAVELCVRRKQSWKPLLFGALTFTVFQGFARLPVLSAFAGLDWYKALQSTQPAIYTLFLGATAALFEESGRWLVMRLLLKKQRGVMDGVAFGVGHGGIEAVVIMGVSALLSLLSSGVMETDPSLVFAGGFERLFTLAAQIGFSVMVLKAVREKKLLWLLLAFAVHTLLAFAVAYSAGYLGDRGGVWSIEIVIGLLAAGMAWFTWKEWKREKTARA